MTVSRVGAASYTASGTGNISPAYSQSPTAGNLLVMGVRGFAGAYPVLGTPAGWTAGPTGQTHVAGNFITVALYWKVATGGDAVPTVTLSANWNTAAYVEEWSGLTAAPFDANSTAGTNNQDNTSAGTCNSGPVTTSNANDWIWTFAGFLCRNPPGAFTWGGGSTVDAYALDAANGYQLGTATQVVSSTGTYTPTLSFAASAGGEYEGVTASMAFKTAATANTYSANPADVAAGADTASGTTGTGAAAAVVQSAQHAATGATVAASLGAAPGTGNTVLAFINSDATFTVSGSGTRRFTYLADQQFDVWEFTGTLPTTVTVTPSASTYCAIVLVEVRSSSGFDLAGTVATSTAGSFSTLTSSSITTTATNDLVFVAAGIHGQSPACTTPTYGNSFTAVDAALQPSGSLSTDMLVGSKTQVSAGAVGTTATSWTGTADNVAGVQIAYKSAGGAGGTGYAATPTDAGAGADTATPVTAASTTRTDTGAGGDSATPSLTGGGDYAKTVSDTGGGGDSTNLTTTTRTFVGWGTPL